ncbi:MAG: DNA internalization-related competence protein ComEC/Rec2 [Gammaproteobacteria bacterium]|nr:DNA internalization-related competence protein ComEC/Rec2 [Gammaproteobacteria bacterium]
MRTGIVAFLLGILALVQCPSLPSAGLADLLPVCLLLALAQPRPRITLLFACGFLYALAHAHAVLDEHLPPELEGQSLTVSGRVISLPDVESHRVRFEFAVDTWPAAVNAQRLPRYIRLSWYTRDPAVSAGERWRLRIRLKQPHGFINPGGFDYEGWLFSHGIRATGYVRRSDLNQRLAPAVAGLLHWREQLRESIDARLGDGRGTALVTALALGDRSGLTQGDWDVLRRTGTSHLLAISGLHIGLVAALAFFAGRWLWSLLPAGMHRLPAQQAAILLSLPAALGYAALAGFALPTQRALIMLLVTALAVLGRQRLRPGDVLLLALLAVLLVDPLAVLAAGLWLSFLAVAVILWGMGWRLPQAGLWWRYGRIQCLIAIGMLPVLLFWFQQFPLFSAVANLVAVPWVSVGVVPLILLGLVLLVAVPAAGGQLLVLAKWLLMGLWPWLEWLGGVDVGLLERPQPAPGLLFAGLAGAALLLLPRAVPSRWIGLLWLLPLIWPQTPRPAPGEYRFAVLDVGQGLAAVVETARHVLVYDTGARFSDSFNAGAAVVVPYLRSRSHDRLDMLIVSHGDNDHIGGTAALDGAFPIDRVLSSVPSELPETAEHCRQGQAWQWDGVHFRILHPPAVTGVNDNNQSCVLRIAGPGGTVLVPGDIEASAERLLIERAARALAADVLVAPHHGSRSSSTPRFIRTVQPDYTVFSTGYRNRYQFPDSDIIQRYEARDVTLFNTAADGAVLFDVGRDGIRISKARLFQRRFWHHGR